MPQDTEGSGLVSLLWGLWIYWTIASWSEYLSSLSQARKQPPTRHGSVTAIAPSTGSPIIANLDAVMSEILRHYGTTAKDFVEDRLAAYEAIVAAFDAGDRGTLRQLVSSEVFAAFSDAIAAREARDERTETIFSCIDPPKILAGRLHETHAEIWIRFVAESYKLSRDTSGQLIGAALDRRRSVDIWTFGCPLSSPTHEWRLVAVEAGVL